LTEKRMGGGFLRASTCGVLLPIAAALAGCGDVVAGNETGGTIETDGFTTSAAKSFPKAEQHCAKYGKRAKILNSQPSTSISVATMTFECVYA
jgi:hypothetical protein